MRLIDADAVKEKIADIWDGRPISFLGARILAMIDEIPTIDAVSVVRCEDCLWGDNEPEVGMCRCRLVAFPLWLRSDGFCSYGERSEDE